MDFEQNLDDSLGIISEEQLAVVDEGNEQSWLYCPEGIDKNVLLDISEFLRFPQHIVPDQTSRVSTLDEKGHEVSKEDHQPINDLERYFQIPGRERRSSFLPTTQNCGSELSAAPTDTTKNRLSFTVVNRSPAHWNKETEGAANESHELVHREIDSPGLPVDEEPKPIVDYEEHGDPTKPTKVRLSFTLEKPSLIWSQGYRRDATESSVQEEETPQLKALPASGLSIFRKSSLPKPVIQNIHRKTPTRNKKECSSAPNTARLNKPKKSRIPTRAREEIKISENGKKLSQATDNPIYSER
ncbi:Hypothetical protein NTJ_03617 [Nesidiocoris tenuis]|uniref:Uncharacterized protein n=1 Tax=Nesidiocoris tenuis TaxID=355587 RepID=A0ABN7AHY8_9HEMI|nr:Hypothetical protein NTJ_03617 [Nesidiocoris tenuis]